MTLKAGFAEIDITPPLGTNKIGWLKKLVIDHIRDPLYARAAVIESPAGRVGFIALDTLSVRWSTVRAIRERISRELQFPGEAVMVGASHNHGGPAVATTGESPRDEAYLADLVDKCVRAFGRAIQASVPARIAMGSGFEFNISFNRRVITRQGVVRTHGSFTDPASLCLEGPIDPEVAVLAARSLDGRALGAIVNFTCHPTHLGGDGTCTAGWPGVYADEMKKRGWPVPLFLQGAAGEIATADPASGKSISMEEMGAVLAADAQKIIEQTPFRETLDRIGSARKTVELPYRRATEEEIKGTIRGAQRFVDPAIYDRGMPALMERIRTRKVQPAEVQAIFLGERVYVSIPAELFVGPGLKIKEESRPAHALVVGYANGMVGYVPSAEAFQRGGYETTFAMSSRLAPEAAGILVDAALGLVKSAV